MTLLNAVPIEKRTTIRAMATALGIGHSQVYRMMKSGNIRAHTNSIKPKLSHDHKIRRLNFILSQIIPPTIDNPPKLSLMYNVVHIDEKWFYMSRKTQRYYLFPWKEEEPYRCVQNKNFIGKVMFIAAVARPQISTNGEVLWDNFSIHRDLLCNKKVKKQTSRYTTTKSNNKSYTRCHSR